jgi:hypothetical protein
MHHSDDCPHPQTIEEIDFEPRRKTDWLHPTELARSGVKTALAVLFGSYADRREMQAALSPVGDPEEEYDRHDFEEGALWFDYVADVGDGFDATYAIARLLASDVPIDGTETKRGAFLVLGGDQVYPTASRDEYHHRFLGPYRAALPYVEPPRIPKMYAIPGNHDWYDGLSSFLHIFCQRGRWVGGWQTRQRRSYFAIRLPGDWWIWAIDGQLESDFDQPQLRYFDAIADFMKSPEKQKIILVTAAPSWTQCPAEGSPATCRNHPDDFRTLGHFEKRIRERGFQLKLVLAGDLHHYMRYVSEAGAITRVTSGGGGAYAFGTARMPADLTVDGASHHRAAAFPDAKESEQIAANIWQLPWHNPRFGELLGVAYLLLAWLLQAGSRWTDIIEPSLLHVAQNRGGGEVFLAYLYAFAFNPLATALGVLIIMGFSRFTAASTQGHPKAAKALGVLHGIAHVALCCGLMTWIARAARVYGLEPGVWFDVILIALLFGLGWLGGSFLYALFLSFTSRTTGVHTNEVFSSIASEDYKHFLRFRLTADGVLTVFAIGLRKVPHDWKFRAPGPDDHGKPWFHSEAFGKGAYAPVLVDSFTLK